MTNDGLAQLAFTSNSNRDTDGGLTALGGFAFQFLGMLKRVLQLPVAQVKPFPIQDLDPDEENEGEPGDQSDIEKEFAVELFDEDGVELQVHPDGKHILCLIQYKYSTTPDETANIDKADLKLILKKMERRFNKAKQALNRNGLEPRYILATNRSPGPELLGILNAKIEGRIHPLVQQDADFQRRFHNFHWEKIDPESCFDAIECAGKEFGLTQREIYDGIGEMVGSLITNLLMGRPLVRPQFIEGKLAGFDNPRRFNSVALREEIRTDIEVDFRRECDVEFEGFGKRDIQQDLEDALDENAFIVLYGNGGNGKTTLLFNVLSRRVKEGFFVSAGKTRGVTSNWICSTIENWRGNSANHCQPELASDSIERLIRASEKRPVLLLALDGLDENVSDSKAEEIYNVIKFFYRETESIGSGGLLAPRATLIVSCRDLTDLGRYLGDVAPGRTNDRIIPGLHLKVESFSQREMSILLKQGVWRGDESIRLRLLKGLQSSLKQDTVQTIRSSSSLSSMVSGPMHSGRDSAATLGSAVSYESSKDVSDDIMNALFHPAVWGVLVNSNWTKTHIDDVLDGTEDGIKNLADGVISWFDERCQRRCQTYPHQARAVLEEAARIQINYEESKHSESHWVRAGRNALEAKSREVLYQALSSGLIFQVSVHSPYDFTWEWQHKFLPRHLNTGRSQL